MYCYSWREAEIRRKLVFDYINDPRLTRFYGGNSWFCLIFVMCLCLSSMFWILFSYYFFFAVVPQAGPSAGEAEVEIDAGGAVAGEAVAARGVADEVQADAVDPEDEEDGFPEEDLDEAPVAEKFNHEDDEEDPDNFFIPMTGNFPEDEEVAEDEVQSENVENSGQANNSGKFSDFFL